MLLMGIVSQAHKIQQTIDEPKISIMAKFITFKIHVDGNWSETAAIYDWCTGSGTYEDPYLIHDLVIDYSGNGSCILVENTWEYFRIENCTLFGEYPNVGIELIDVTNGVLVNNTCSNGIVLTSSDNNMVVGNNCTGSPLWGVYLSLSNNNTISKNNLNENVDGIFLSSSSNNKVSGNNCSENSRDGICLLSSSNFNIVMNNSCLLNSDLGIYIASSNNNIVEKNICNKNIYGIYFTSSNNNIASFNNCTENSQTGIYFDSFTNNTVEGNICTGNFHWGIFFSQSSGGNFVVRNKCSWNSRDGIFVGCFNQSTIMNNNCSGNSRDGIYVYCSSNNTIIRNNCTGNSRSGFYFFSEGSSIFGSSDNNILSNNDCFKNYYGIYLWNSKENRLYLNNFLNNDENVYSSSSNNVWYSSEPLIYTYNNKTYTNFLGNHWSDYMDSDTNEDGIGDTQYNIGEDKDNYPLMKCVENYKINQAPNQPITISPVSGAGTSLIPTLQSYAFSDPDTNDTHSTSQWQITKTSGDYSSPVFNSGVDMANLTSIRLSPVILNYATTYFWRVRYQDNHGEWSKYSLETYFTTCAQAGPDVIWSQSFNSGFEDVAPTIALDSHDNIVITGTSYADPDHNYYTIKYDSEGNFLWDKSFDSGYHDWAKAVVVDSQDNVLVTGYSFITPSYYDCTIKYDSNGNFLWKRTSSGVKNAYGVTVDSQDNVIVTGTTWSWDTETYDYYTLKYDSSGTILWNRTYDGGEDDQANDVGVDSEDNILVTGESNSDVCTLKYSPEGNLLWSQISDSSYLYGGYGVATDSQDNVLVAGTSMGSNYDPEYIFTIKYDSNGIELWKRAYSDVEDGAYDIAIDSLDNIIVTGFTRPGEYPRGYDYCLIKYNPQGDLIWSQIHDSGESETAFGVAIDLMDNIVITGHSFDGSTKNYLIMKYQANMFEMLEVETIFETDLKLTKAIVNHIVCKFIKPTPENIAILAHESIGIVAQEGHMIRGGYLLEITNIKEIMLTHDLPQYVIDFIDFFLSQDDVFRLLLVYNFIDIPEIDDYFTAFVQILSIIKDIFDKSKASVPASWRWFYEHDAIKNLFHITRGTNQYQLKLKKRLIPSLLQTVADTLSIFFSGGIYLLNARPDFPRPLPIFTFQDLVWAMNICLDIVSLVTKIGGIIASGSTALWLYLKAGVSFFKFIYELVVDPPEIIDYVVEYFLPDLYTWYQENIREALEKSMGWMYTIASLMDPLDQRLDIGICDADENILLGYDPITNTTIYNTTWGSYIGDENLQILFLNLTQRPNFNLTIRHTSWGEDLAPLNYSMTIKQGNITNTYFSVGELLPNTSNTIPVSYIENVLILPIFNVTTLSDTKDMMEFLVLDSENLPITLDIVQVFIDDKLVACNYTYVGEGKYRITWIDTLLQDGCIVHFVFTKFGYLQQTKTIGIFTPLLQISTSKYSYNQGEKVYLIANTTPDTDVAFEVDYPNTIVHSIFTNTSDSSGIATYSFYLEKTSPPGIYNVFISTIQANVSTTFEVTEKIDITPPEITGLTHSPVDPQPTDTVTIEVNITDVESHITSVTLYYSTDGGSWSSKAMTGDDSFYSTTIGPFTHGTTSQYFVNATNDSGFSTVSSIQFLFVQDTIAPSLSNLTHDPIQPTTEEIINVSINGVDLGSGIQSVILFTSSDGGNTWTTRAMSGTGSTYSTTVGPFDVGIIQYYVNVTDNVGNSQISELRSFSVVETTTTTSTTTKPTSATTTTATAEETSTNITEQVKGVDVLTQLFGLSLLITTLGVIAGGILIFRKWKSLRK
jgi:uncharacterized delta-60 repeat protein